MACSSADCAAAPSAVARRSSAAALGAAAHLHGTSSGGTSAHVHGSAAAHPVQPRVPDGQLRVPAGNDSGANEHAASRGAPAIAAP
jgi:hypothetical protein